tara:strand:+ start:127 stop:417 length:291 start_codon:yes stop_codon:yes gene_type:complete
MLRKLLILTIFTLIILTTFTKNHTKKLDDELFSIRENINYLNSVKELVELEHNYLSSPEKLNEFNKIYFDNKFRFSYRENIKIIKNISEINFKSLE